MCSLTRHQLREIDRLAAERYHIPSLVLMENAARSAADLAWRMLDVKPGRPVLVLCGGGNNGGDGLAVARHLHNRGAAVCIGLCIDPARYSGDALTNWQIAQAMNLPCLPATPEWILSTPADLILDAIFGTGLTSAPRLTADNLIDTANHHGAPILAIDLPSGLDCDTGQPLGACICAAATISLVALKAGFTNPSSADFTGQVTIGDIGCPKELIEEIASARRPCKPPARP